MTGYYLEAENATVFYANIMPATSARTILAILMGDPVTHSKSPAVMSAAAEAAGVDMVYTACRVQSSDLAQAVDAIHALGMVGANVTIPHKERVISFLDDLTAAARAVGAVNMIFRDGEGRLVGDNTDTVGFTAPIREQGLASALVLGTGGAARAAAWACATTLGMDRVLVCGRNTEKAEQLVVDLNTHADSSVQRAPWEDRSRLAGTVDLVVNATPLGMAPHVDASPLDDPSHLSAAQLVYDLVYNPAETRLLNEAKRQGARTQGGLDMLIGQAAAAFHQWTGKDMDLDAVRRALTT